MTSSNVARFAKGVFWAIPITVTVNDNFIAFAAVKGASMAPVLNPDPRCRALDGSICVSGHEARRVKLLVLTTYYCFLLVCRDNEAKEVVVINRLSVKLFNSVEPGDVVVFRYEIVFPCGCSNVSVPDHDDA